MAKGKKFKFRLQVVLEYKQRIEDEEKKKFAKVMQKLQEAEKHLQFLINTREIKKNEMREKMSVGSLNVYELQMYHLHIDKLSKDIVKQKEVIKEIEKEVEEQRQRLIAAAREKKVYEKLKEKKLEEFKKELEAEERKFIDELASVKAARIIMGNE